MSQESIISEKRDDRCPSKMAKQETFPYPLLCRLINGLSYFSLALLGSNCPINELTWEEKHVHHKRLQHKLHCSFVLRVHTLCKRSKNCLHDDMTNSMRGTSVSSSLYLSCQLNFSNTFHSFFLFLIFFFFSILRVLETRLWPLLFFLL